MLEIRKESNLRNRKCGSAEMSNVSRQDFLSSKYHPNRVFFISISFARISAVASNLLSKIKLKSPPKTMFFCYNHQLFHVVFVERRMQMTGQALSQNCKNYQQNICAIQFGIENQNSSIFVACCVYHLKRFCSAIVDCHNAIASNNECYFAKIKATYPSQVNVKKLNKSKRDTIFFLPFSGNVHKHLRNQFNHSKV